MNKLNNEQKVISRLFKDFLTFYNSRTISKVIGISHPGAFKILKKLEKREIVKPKTIGKAVIYSLNFDNPVSKREVERILTIEAYNYKKWAEEFKELKDKAEFIILFGSIIRNEKEARDIDLLVVCDKSNVNYIKSLIGKKNNILNKKVHLLPQITEDFAKDLGNKNKVIIEIIKTGVVLFGQEKLIKHMEKFFEK